MRNSIHRENTLIIIPSLGTGGAELQLINQFRFLKEKGNTHFHLCVLTSELEHLDKIACPKSQTLLLNYPPHMNVLNLASIKSSYGMAKKVKRFIDANNISKVLAILTLSHIVGRWVKFMRPNMELTIWYRNIESENIGRPNLLKSIFFKVMSGAARKLDDKAIYISNAVKEDIENNFARIINSRIIHNSLPLNIIERAPALKLLSDFDLNISKQYIIVIPGRVKLKQKGHGFFAEGFRKFLDLHNPTFPIKVLVAGDGEISLLKELVRELRLENYFLMLGNVDNNTLLSLLRVSDLVVIPSLYEGFGNVAIEALQQEANLLVSSAGGLDEIVCDGVNGAKFEANNEIALIEKLKAILLDDYFRDISKSTIYKSYLDRFTLDYQMNQLIDFLYDGK